ncbi:MAG: hypothetical protein V3U54_04185 [Thermodesulfobacteriota bacterium]
MGKNRENINYRIYIDSSGHWFWDRIKITHKWTYLYNNSLLSRDKEGNYYIDDGSGRVYIEVEDTPFIVTMINKHKNSFLIRLNDQTEEKLDLNNLWISEKNIPYTMVKGSEFNARFSRPAHYELSKHYIQEGNNFYININSKKYFIKKLGNNSDKGVQYP